MSRYIDADAIAEQIKDLLLPTSLMLNDIAQRKIENAPSIDIVRCGECAKRKKNKFCLEHMRYERDDNGFCSYGVKKGADDE